MLPIQRSCDVENILDFIRYYQSSWVGWHPEDVDKIYPCFVGGISLNHDSVTLRSLIKTEDGKINLDTTLTSTWKDLNERIDFGLPDIGMIQEGPTVAFCSYSTPRMAKKGYRTRDAKITNFNDWEIRNKYISNSEIDKYASIWSIFNPKYVSLEEAEEQLSKGSIVGTPLSRTLGVYSLPKFEHSLLAYKRWTIGYVVNPFLIHIRKEYADYEEDIASQTGAEVVVSG